MTRLITSTLWLATLFASQLLHAAEPVPVLRNEMPKPITLNIALSNGLTLGMQIDERVEYWFDQPLIELKHFEAITPSGERWVRTRDELQVKRRLHGEKFVWVFKGGVFQDSTSLAELPKAP